MSLHWHVRQPPTRERGKPPSVWIGVAIFIVVQVIGTVITVLTWGQKPVVSADFFVRLFVLPTSVSAALCALVYRGYERNTHDTDWWNYLCHRLQSRWRSWAQQRVVIVAAATLTPESELAERMLGLEGPRPDNAGKQLPLVNQDQTFGGSRLESVFHKVLTPLSETVVAVARKHTLHVCLQSRQEDDLVELKQVWERAALPSSATFSWLSFETPLSLAEPWLDTTPESDFRLTLACQLHQPGEEPKWSEAAVALLTTSPSVMSGFQGKLKPLAYLFRPISVESDQVAEAVHALQRAQQAPPERIKHLWVSGLAGQPRHATESAVRDCGLELPTHDLGEAVGDPGPVSPLLLHALAAQMVRHGHGTQLLATSASLGVQLNLIGNQLAPVESIEPEYYPLFRLSTTIGLLGAASFALFGTHTVGGMPSWLPGVVLAVVALTLPLQMLLSVLWRRETTSHFSANL